MFDTLKVDRDGDGGISTDKYIGDESGGDYADTQVVGDFVQEDAQVQDFPKDQFACALCQYRCGRKNNLPAHRRKTLVVVKTKEECGATSIGSVNPIKLESYQTFQCQKQKK